MTRLHGLLAVGALAVAASAQIFSHVVPNGTAGTEGNSSNAFPWGRGPSASLVTQLIYDSTNFTSAGINYPIVVSRLRWRLNGGVGNAATAAYTQATIDMATALNPAATASTTFAANMAGDLTTVYSGPIAIQPVAATTPGQWFVDVTLTTPFTYDPSTGNGLVIHTDIPPGVGSGVPVLQLDVQTTGSNACRVFNSTTYGAATGTRTLNHGVVCELGYLPVSGLFPDFLATPTSGASPLLVQYTDNSFSSDPAGITSWSWDLDGDGVVDSTQQNPSFLYGTCGAFNVSLTVTDAVHGTRTVTKNGFVTTDPLQADFTWQHNGNGIYQFTDTSSPPPQTWAWDFDGDNVVDSTAQNPIWVYPLDCTVKTAALTTTLNCRTSNTSQTIVASAASLASTPATNNGNANAQHVGNMFDISVTAPEGISVCTVTVKPDTFTGPFNVDVYVTPDSYVGRNAQPEAWRLVGTGSANALGGIFSNPTPIDVVMTTPFYLPAGNYGVAVYLSRVPLATVNIAYTNAPQGPFSNADLTFFPSPTTAPGIATLGLFSTTTTSSRAFSGTFHYTKVSLTSEAGYGFFGAGCPSSLGVTRLTATSPPVLGGTLTVQADNLPLNAAISVLGFSNTTSAFGPLPLDLGIVGAPGCFARVRDDATSFFGGAGNTATWSLGIPNNPSLLAARAFQQVFVLDVGFNALGAVTSDAAGFVIGQ